MFLVPWKKPRTLEKLFKHANSRQELVCHYNLNYSNISLKRGIPITALSVSCFMQNDPCLTCIVWHDSAVYCFYNRLSFCVHIWIRRKRKASYYNTQNPLHRINIISTLHFIRKATKTKIYRERPSPWREKLERYNPYKLQPHFYDNTVERQLLLNI